MNAVLVLIVFGFGSITVIAAGKSIEASTTMELQVPKFILPQETFNATYVYTGIGHFRMMVKNCEIMFEPGEDGGLSKTIRVAHLNKEMKECVVSCFSASKRIVEKVLVTEGVIASKYYNMTVSKGISFTLTCSSRCKPGTCQVVWRTNNTSVFVKNDEEHTVWSGPSHKDTQSHYLTVYSASTSTDYHCSLISITDRIIDSAKQYVYVKEPGNGTTRMLIGHLKP